MLLVERLEELSQHDEGSPLVVQTVLHLLGQQIQPGQISVDGDLGILLLGDEERSLGEVHLGVRHRHLLGEAPPDRLGR